MTYNALIWNEILTFTPCFSAIMWMFFLLLARYDSFTIQERNIKKTLFWFYGFTILIWFSFFVYNYYPVGFVFLNSIVYAVSLLRMVLYYRFIHQLTSPDTRKKISAWHYAVAAVVPGTLLICSFFIPFEVQKALVTGRGQWYPGYTAYSFLFLSKPVLIFIYGTVYTVMAIRKLFVYYAMAAKKESEPIQLVHWVIGLIVVTLFLLLFSLFMLLVPRSQLASTGKLWGLILFSCSQHIVLGYNVIRRNFLLYILKEDRKEENRQAPPAEKRKLNTEKRIYKRTSEVIRTPEGKLRSTPLTQKRFESYIQDNKAFLNPKLKITDLIEPLKANRTAISNFVNTTYNINFNRYINSLRLREMERLQKMPSNLNKGLPELATMAGFSDIRHYRRALETEQENNRNDNLTEKKEQ